MKFSKLYKELSPYFKTFKKDKIFLTILIIINSILGIFVPFLMRDLINSITKNENIEIICRTGLSILIVSITLAVLNCVQGYFWHRLRLAGVNCLRKEVFRSTMYKNQTFFNQNTVGNIVTHILDDTSITAQNMVIGKLMLFSNCLDLTIIAFVLFKLNWMLFLIVMLAMPIYFFVFHHLNKRIRKTTKEDRDSFSLVMDDTQEKVRSINTIVVNQKEEFVIEKFSGKLERYFTFVKKNLLYARVGGSINTCIVSILPIIILLCGSVMIQNGLLELGALIAFFTYLSNIYQPLSNFSDFALSLPVFTTTGKRIVDFLNEGNIISQGEIEIEQFESLEFQGVSFSYDDKVDVISKLSFYINKGEKVAIIGESGAGKTTLLQLILKRYAPTKGKILLNGYDLNDVSAASVYQIFSVSFQDAFLFDGTILDNITWQQDALDRNRLDEALLVAQINESQAAFADLTKNINQNNMSGGQRQRLCIARTLYRLYDVLILDEPTSALNHELSEKMVHDLKSLPEDKTFLIITHTKEMLKICTKVIEVSPCATKA